MSVRIQNQYIVQKQRTMECAHLFIEQWRGGGDGLFVWNRSRQVDKKRECRGTVSAGPRAQVTRSLRRWGNKCSPEGAVFRKKNTKLVTPKFTLTSINANIYCRTVIGIDGSMSIECYNKSPSCCLPYSYNTDSYLTIKVLCELSIMRQENFGNGFLEN